MAVTSWHLHPLPTTMEFLWLCKLKKPCKDKFMQSSCFAGRSGHMKTVCNLGFWIQPDSIQPYLGSELVSHLPLTANIPINNYRETSQSFTCLFSTNQNTHQIMDEAKTVRQQIKFTHNPEKVIMTERHGHSFCPVLSPPATLPAFSFALQK